MAGHSRASSLQLALLSLLSAFLLFQVQPVIGKFILPWFGGGPGVWTTSMLFFQVLLFAGYAYAHGLTRLPGRWQFLIHGVIVLAAVFMLPIAPGEKWRPANGDDPVSRILLLLLANVALPYFALSSTSPLVQVWFSRADESRKPWKLYALSNIGSLAALLSYPFFFEPRWDVVEQTRMWSGAFVVFAVLSWLGARADLRAPTAPLAAEVGPGADDASTTAVSWWRRALWLALPAVASALLLATTNHLCEDVAVIPFLWVLPLALYLGTFIICFERERWYARPLWAPAAMLLLVAAGAHEGLADAAWFHHDLAPDFRHEIALVGAAMYLGCMVCHGELSRLKPAPRHLTEFYLFMSAGGALGGMIVSLLAPRIFNTYAEWPLALVVTFAIAALSLVRAAWSRAGWARRVALFAVVTGSTVAGQWFVSKLMGEKDETRIDVVRNFYGVVSVHEDYDANGAGWRTLYHGSIIHGHQYLSPEWRNEPLSYYGHDTGIGRALLTLKGRKDARVGVVGMGTGTTASYGEKGQVFRFYDINPEIPRIARKHFHFLGDLEKRGGRVDVVMGDARQSLEHEPPQNYDVLLLDAFSGDAVPVHLLTREAFEIYRRHMKPDGIIAVHVSNRYLALAPVVERLAAAISMKTTRVVTELDGFDEYTSYVLVTNNDAFLKANPSEAPDKNEPPAPSLWTDRRHNLFEILLKE
ncbi:MAG: fused MFS/spermidine synthase [Verrucomicrobiaceae bacterium]|nr:fused MFS/spermidine synthase [Verrucomicrobiaceae bacterium]